MKKWQKFKIYCELNNIDLTQNLDYNSPLIIKFIKLNNTTKKSVQAFKQRITNPNYLLHKREAEQRCRLNKMTETQVDKYWENWDKRNGVSW